MDKESVLLDSEDRMDKALGALDRDFSRLRTGRASTGLVDNIKVDYYGGMCWWTSIRTPTICSTS